MASKYTSTEIIDKLHTLPMPKTTIDDTIKIITDLSYITNWYLVTDPTLNIIETMADTTLNTLVHIINNTYTRTIQYENENNQIQLNLQEPVICIFGDSILIIDNIHLSQIGGRPKNTYGFDLDGSGNMMDLSIYFTIVNTKVVIHTIQIKDSVYNLIKK